MRLEAPNWFEVESYLRHDNNECEINFQEERT